MRHSQINDAQLISAFQGGDSQALHQLIGRHQKQLLNFIYSKTYDWNLADDLLQDTFIKIINTVKKGKYKEEGKFISWALRIANNLIMDYYRKEKRNQEYAAGDLLYKLFEDFEPSIENKIISDQGKIDVVKYLDQLPVDQQEVIKLRFFNEYSFKEIAEETEVSINTALGRMRYAVINIRKMMEKNVIN